MVVERVLQIFESLGYSRRSADWLRGKRLWVILVLAILAWVPFVLLVAALL